MNLYTTSNHMLEGKLKFELYYGTCMQHYAEVIQAIRGKQLDASGMEPSLSDRALKAQGALKKEKEEAEGCDSASMASDEEIA